jgi:hypothetical protein
MIHVYSKECFGKISAPCQGVHNFQPCLFVFNKTQIAPHFFAELFHTNIHEKLVEPFSFAIRMHLKPFILPAECIHVS